MRLRRLKHGDVIATQKNLDHVIRAAENYIGIKVEGFAEETAPTPGLTPNANRRSSDILEKPKFRIEARVPRGNLKSGLTPYANSRGSDTPEKTRFRIKARVLQGSSKVEEQQPKKHKQEESSTPHKPFQESRRSLANSFTAGNSDDRRPGFSQTGGSRLALTLGMPRSPKHNSHRAAPAQDKGKTNKPVTFSTGHQLGSRNA